VLVYGIARDRNLMGEHALGRAGTVASLAVMGLVAVCLVTLAVLSIG